MALTIEQALARVPLWAGATKIRTTPLGGGITNQNYRVDVDGQSYVLRITGEKTELLGIDRKNEYAANVAAAKIGIAPEVVYLIEPEGYLVTRFVDGRTIPREEISRPENMRRVASVLRKIHAMPEIPGKFSPFRTIDSYREIARRYKVEFPSNFPWIVAQMSIIESAFKRDPVASSPCHNDLLNENFLDDGKIRILDWEYAGMGDPAFDLANLAVHHGLNEEQDVYLLESYYATLRPLQAQELLPKLARHKLMKIVSDCREAMWGLVQVGISKLEFDFRAYADKHFNRMTANIQNGSFSQWLEMIAPKESF